MSHRKRPASSARAPLRSSSIPIAVADPFTGTVTEFGVTIVTLTPLGAGPRLVSQFRQHISRLSRFLASLRMLVHLLIQRQNL